MKNKKGILEGLIVSLTLATPLVAFAQLTNPDLPVEGEGLTLDIIAKIIQQIAQFMLTMGVVIAVIFIIWGGIKWMMAGDDATKIKAAKERIKSGVIGAVIVLGVGLILATISKVVTGAFFGGF